MTCYDSDPKHPHQPRLGSLKSWGSEGVRSVNRFSNCNVWRKQRYVYDMVSEVQMCYDRWIYDTSYKNCMWCKFDMFYDVARRPPMSHMRKSRPPWLLLPSFRPLNDTVTPSRLLQIGPRCTARWPRFPKAHACLNWWCQNQVLNFQVSERTPTCSRGFSGKGGNWRCVTSQRGHKNTFLHEECVG